MRPSTALVTSFCLFSVLCSVGAARGQTEGAAANRELFKTIASLDQAVFHAYNTCDLEKFGSFFAADVEFYHDKGGVTLGRERLVESVKNNICGKTRREAVPATLEVYPMDGYGALQTGSHLFCGLTATRCEGIAKYIHLWQHKNGAWTITRVVSYDHRENQ